MRRNGTKAADAATTTDATTRLPPTEPQKSAPTVKLGSAAAEP